jgi:glyoxylase-like metal-dependent hydrolase (beta-lactamase superfamily II)
LGALRQITERVYWLPPGPPDRPSLCGVVGDRWTLALDAGSSAAHTRGFLEELAAETGTRPSAVVYTHSHWDHVLGGEEIGGIVIAQALTAEGLLELAQRDWSDEGLDRRVAAGLSSPEHAANVREELPAPRTVEIAPADVVFQDSIEIDLGGVRIRASHLGGDHSADSTVISVEPDGVLFLGDCLCASPEGVLTSVETDRLRDAVLGSEAEHYVEGHHDAVSSRSDMESLLEKMRHAERAARAGVALESPDEDTEYFAAAFRAGLAGAISPPGA